MGLYYKPKCPECNSDEIYERVIDDEYTGYLCNKCGHKWTEI